MCDPLRPERAFSSLVRILRQTTVARNAGFARAFRTERAAAGRRSIGMRNVEKTRAGTASPPRRGKGRSLTAAQRCRRKFLGIFPEGFQDQDYLDLERNYKWEAHKRWCARLARPDFEAMLERGAYDEIAKMAIAVESRTNLIFSYEKMALRDATRPPAGARLFATALFDFLHGKGALQSRFHAWREAVAALPRPKSRVLTWPVLTVFGFLAQPQRHFYLKPTVTRRAAQAYGYDLSYSSRPDWQTYDAILAFAKQVADDLADLKPRDMIDIQSFLWVQGSDEY
jgi:hypothetical protein